MIASPPMSFSKVQSRVWDVKAGLGFSWEERLKRIGNADTDKSCGWQSGVDFYFLDAVRNKAKEDEPEKPEMKVE